MITLVAERPQWRRRDLAAQQVTIDPPDKPGDDISLYFNALAEFSP